MWGSQILQRIARQVRQSENNLVMAEKMGVIANLSNGYRYKQEDLDEAWRTLMLAQHHDSWIVPYNRLHGQKTWADEIRDWTQATNLACGNILKEASDSFTTGKTGTKRTYLRVYNTLGVPKREIVSAELPGNFTGVNLKVTDATGKRTETFIKTEDSRSFLVFEAEVPAFGYAIYYVVPDKRAGNRRKIESAAGEEEIVLKNSMYRIVIDPLKGGVIKSLIAKKEGNREFSDNNSEFNIGELHGFFYDEGLFHSSIEKPAVVSVVQENPFEKSVRIEGEIASHPFTQTIIIQEGQRKIDFDLTIDWKSNVGIGEYYQTDAYANNRRAFYDDRFKLNVLFPVDLNAPVLYKNAPFDVCRSELENTHFNTWDGIKHTIILNWVDLTNQKGEYGFSLLSDHTTSYSYGENFPLGLTVQFSGNGLWGRDYPIEGPTHIRFAVIPHSKEWNTSHIHTESLRWDEPLIPSFQREAKPENISLINVEETGYEIVTSYLCDEGIIMRLFNADGNDSPKVIKFGTSLSKVAETDLNGNTLSTLPTLYTEEGTEVEVAMPRFGLKTLKLITNE